MANIKPKKQQHDSIVIASSNLRDGKIWLIPVYIINSAY